MKCTEDEPVLKFTFNFYCNNDDVYRSKHLSFISRVIKLETKGWLIDILKEEGLATSIGAETESSFVEIATLLVIDIVLTEKGVKQLKDVCEIVFSFLSQLRSMTEEGELNFFIDEIEKMSQLQYQFREKLEGTDYVCDLSYYSLFLDEQEKLLKEASGIDVFESINREKIVETLSSMTWPLCLVILMNSRLMVKGDVETEPWYESSFKRSPKPELKLRKLDIQILKANPYLPESVDLIPAEVTSEKLYP